MGVNTKMSTNMHMKVDVFCVKCLASLGAHEDSHKSAHGKFDSAPKDVHKSVLGQFFYMSNFHVCFLPKNGLRTPRACSLKLGSPRKS